MNKAELDIFAEVLRIAAKTASSRDIGYVERAEEILQKEARCLAYKLSLEPRLAEDMNGHVFLAAPEDRWMVSRFLEGE